MNNEPVAWMDGEGGFYHNDDYEVCKKHNIADDLIPLYTHPAETITLAELRKTDLYRTEQTRSLRQFLEPKELTDEEIWGLAKEIGWKEVMIPLIIPLGRAILRKAQGK